MNPRVSRSSALASKATGYPIAKLAALLAVGYTLDELPNDITGESSAAFEPALDYVAVKAPRFDFEKFPGNTRELGTEMRAVGEALGIGRTFPEALLKALEGVEAGDSLPEIPGLHPVLHGGDRVDPRGRARARRGRRRRGGKAFRAPRRSDRPDPRRLRVGGTRAAVAFPGGSRSTPAPASSRRGRPTTTSRTSPATASATATGAIVVLGSGTNRIGQGIEFDYCCVRAAQAFRAGSATRSCS